MIRYKLYVIKIKTILVSFKFFFDENLHLKLAYSIFSKFFYYQRQFFFKLKFIFILKQIIELVFKILKEIQNTWKKFTKNLKEIYKKHLVTLFTLFFELDYVLLKTVFLIKVKFYTKNKPKNLFFKNLKEIQKTWKYFLKNIWQPW